MTDKMKGGMAPASKRAKSKTQIMEEMVAAEKAEKYTTPKDEGRIREMYYVLLDILDMTGVYNTTGKYLAGKSRRVLDDLTAFHVEITSNGHSVEGRWAWVSARITSRLSVLAWLRAKEAGLVLVKEAGKDDSDPRDGDSLKEVLAKVEGRVLAKYHADSKDKPFSKATWNEQAV